MRKNITKSLIQIFGRMTLILLFLVGMFGSLPAGSASADGAIIYVDTSASGADDGTSWADAYPDLQSAISAAVSSDEIWVAAGTYYPTAGVDRTISFTLKNGVSIYGGFDGTETLLSQRDPDTNITILSGDIGTSNQISDNSYHVVSGGGTDNSAVLDGFTITKGNADLLVIGGQEQYGAGIYNLNSSPTLNNLILTGNTTPRYGAGMYNSASSPKLNKVIFINNTAQRAGGMYNTNFSNPELTNVIFSNNDASSRGGGMTTAESSAPILTNVTFSGNTADWGAAIHNTDGFPTLINVTISGNTADEDGGGLYNDVSTPTLINVTISNNSAGLHGDGIFNANSNSVIKNSIIYGNAGEAIYDVGSTPDVTYSIIEGGYSGTGNKDMNPLLGSLGDNGGFTQTMAPGVGSPAIDAGTDTGCPAEDQRGFTRPQGAQCDMGAVEVDNQVPTTTLDGFPSNPDSDNTPTFTFSGDDDGGSGVASFLCRMDGASYVPCTSPFTSAPLLAGSHTFDVYAVDHASNADPTPASHTWTLEFTPTNVTSIVRANASPTSLGSVNFTVTFSADVTGVDTGDFVLTTNGVKNASVSGVAGTGDTYTVTVNTGTQSGTIRLDIPSAATIQDSFGNQPVNLPFTSGEVYTVKKGADTTGVFRPSNGALYLKNSNTTGFADVQINYGQGGDYPVTGDWDGNGTATIGIYRNGSFYLRNFNTIGFANIVFPFGAAGDQPIAGDWNGDGIDTIGVYRSSSGTFFLRNSNTAGPADMIFSLGIPGDVGIAGDWTGKGFDTTGVFRPSNGALYLKHTNATGFADIQINYGQGGDQPVVGDWDDNGTDTIGVYRNGTFMLRNSNTIGFAELVFDLGVPGDMPIAGNWNGIP